MLVHGQDLYYIYNEWSLAGHILSRIYNCTKPGNRPIENAATAHFTLQFRFYNCTNCAQLHTKICRGHWCT